MFKKNLKGSLTVEAAIVFPIFIFTIFTIGFFIKILYVNETMHQGVTEVANEMSRLGYLYSKTGLLDVQKEIQEEIDIKNIELDNKSNYQNILNIIENTINNQDIEDSDLIFNIANSLTENLKILKNSCTKDGLDFVFKVVCNAIAENIFKGYISEKQLIDMNIKDGYNGLDFSLSRYFYTQEAISDQIDLILTYDIQIPDPLNLIGNISMCQGANVRVWTGSSRFYYGATNNQNINDETLKVYIIGQGTHYHLSSCSRINIEKKLVTRQEAIDKGYVPCEHCKPQTSEYVYITKYGECYHMVNCPHVNPKVKEISLKQAKEKNYKPCKICKPPH